MNCQKTGVTRLLLTKIPFYKELVLMSFRCENCGYENNEIQSGAQVGEKGVRFTLIVETERDLNRQVVKSDNTSVKLVELDFEIPASSQKGEITTVEGIINRSIVGLEQDQPLRRIQHPETATQIESFIEKLKKLKELETPFTLVLEDISGNCFVENPNAPMIDKKCKAQYFARNREQDHELGIFTKEEVTGEKNTDVMRSECGFTLKDLEGEVLQFPTNCHGCGSPCSTNMKMTNIPHFKEVIIMATICDRCGLKTNEVKSGGGIEPKGIRIEVDIKEKDDFSRDLLKSETCSLMIPQLEMEVGPHALSGRFTTVEGLIIAVKDQLNDPQHAFIFRDSEESRTKTQFEKFIQKIDNSMRDDNQPDERLRVMHYERSFDQNEELGLNDINTENYQMS
ncbi:hypothetical protein NQ318_013265 [Aromia moschata]|uniref:Zinc finger protein 259 n=1 Tax=Aromia moschata TaxID=1265417 RepID=A0AAV8XTP5_9CUCU|nr:hypothetical protein NQ318_013265 [Aromia moschata]